MKGIAMRTTVFWGLFLFGSTVFAVAQPVSTPKTSTFDVGAAQLGCGLATGGQVSCTVATNDGRNTEVLPLDQLPTDATPPKTGKLQVIHNDSVTGVTTYKNYNYLARTKFLASTLFDGEAALATDVMTSFTINDSDGLLEVLDTEQAQLDWLNAMSSAGVQPGIFLAGEDGTTIVVDLNQATLSNIAAGNWEAGVEKRLGWTIDRSEWLRNGDETDSNVNSALSNFGVTVNETSRLDLINWLGTEKPTEIFSVPDQ